MSKFIALMYHSIYSTESEYNEISDEDKPYALHSDEFEKHLIWISNSKYNIIDPNNISSYSGTKSKVSILITFDDGHIGFFRYAYPILCKYNLSAIFFITTDFIGVRSEFCNWKQLDEMSKNNMLIQSHGKTHKFISDMPESEMESELKISKHEIETNTHSNVWALSFPGGRYISSSIRIAQDLGYTHYFTSEAVQNNSNVLSGGTVGRFAIKSNTNVNDLFQFIEPSITTLFKRKLVTFIKYILKRVLGNYGYHKIYKIMNKAK